MYFYLLDVGGNKRMRRPLLLEQERPFFRAQMTRQLLITPDSCPTQNVPTRAHK